MLKSLRKNTKVIIWAVVVSFVLWGGFSVGVQFQKKNRFAGEVFGQGIPFQEFDSFYRAVQIFSFGSEPVQDPDQLRQQAWQSLILAREAERQRLKVQDEEVREELMRLLKAQGLESLDPQAYSAWVQSALRQTPQQFEKQVRDFLLIQKLVDKVQAEMTAAPSEDAAFERFLQEERKLTAEMIKFQSREEADKFRADYPDARKWAKAKQAFAEKLTSMTQIAAGALISQWGMQPADADKLFALEAEKSSEALPIGGGFGVFQVTEKITPDRAAFDKDFKKDYLEKLAAEDRSRQFIRWNIELLTKANLQDYLAEQGA